MKPQTRYARSGDVNIAYQVVGEGPRDLVLVPGWLSNIEVFWEDPRVTRFLERLASFSRLILFDKRGTGLSDRVADMPYIETRMDDVRAVLDAVGSTRAALCGYSEGGPMCALFAATYPERTSALIMLGSYARLRPDADYPWGRPPEANEVWIEECRRDWGGPVGMAIRVPTLAADESARQWWARFLRMSASPAGAVALIRMNYQIDIRHVLPVIRVPTLILHSAGDRTIDVGAGRFLAERIAGAKYVELPGIDHVPWGDDSDAILGEIEEFLTGVRHGAEPDRVLATVLFTDIVGATEKAASLGDRRWRDLLDAYYTVVRQALVRFRGREIDTAGDGFLATFDGPARGVRAACAVGADAKRLGLEVRAGLHTGECEVMGAKLGGIAVHIGARIAALGQASEVLVSSTVRDLVAGSGLRFGDRGRHVLKGVPGEWNIFAVERESATAA
jgi:pimeloyl-ACP methyl ester carboxylesterase/class 3 adenylate cyclase